MGSIQRKLARHKEKQAKKEMKQKLAMFDKLADECAACQKHFDKKSKEDVTTWSVVVREKEEIVRLYCPECWAMAKKIIKEVQDDFGIQGETGGDSPEPSKP